MTWQKWILSGLLYMGFSLLTSHSFAQNNYSGIAAKFLTFYNKESSDSLFNLYTDDLKARLPLEKTKSLISGLHVEFGYLHGLDLIKEDSGFNQYKASFDHQTLTLLLALTPKNQIEGFRLVPYSAEPLTKPNTNEK